MSDLCQLPEAHVTLGRCNMSRATQRMGTQGRCTCALCMSFIQAFQEGAETQAVCRLKRWQRENRKARKQYLNDNNKFQRVPYCTTQPTQQLCFWSTQASY